MISIMINKDKCNVEFKRLVNLKMQRLINKNFIICSVKFKTDKFNRYTGAIIRYTGRVKNES